MITTIESLLSIKLKDKYNKRFLIYTASIKKAAQVHSTYYNLPASFNRYLKQVAHDWAVTLSISTSPLVEVCTPNPSQTH